MTPTSADAPSPGGLSRLALALAVVLGAGACTASGPDESGRWGSGQASLTLADSGGSLHILASGGCYGSYGDFDQSLPEGAFTVPGTYTQLIGAYPGMIQYPARFSGTVGARQLSITVTVPALQGAIGPFTLTRGVTRAWPACLYP
jgi:hypothetical protein